MKTVSSLISIENLFLVFSYMYGIKMRMNIHCASHTLTVHSIV